MADENFFIIILLLDGLELNLVAKLFQKIFFLSKWSIKNQWGNRAAPRQAFVHITTNSCDPS